MNVAEPSSRGRLAAVAALLAALTFVLYLRAGSFEFLNYDDPDYVSSNPAVAQGLTPAGVSWAFGFQASNWHPLTWLSHMLDVQLFGPEPGPMHVENAALHSLNAALLFLALAALTARHLPSLLVAALFAFHPLRVQCVAWIAERKELLAGAFFCALLIAYARYARSRGKGAYLAVLACLVLGCMAKPMLVTVPFLLLLLDAWPLNRWGGSRPGASPPTTPSLAPTHPGDAPARPTSGRYGFTLFLEKLPLFAVAAASCVLTVLAQHAGGALGSFQELPLVERIWTAGAGVLAYLRATVWPAGLAVFYPHPLLIGQSVLGPGIAGVALALLVSVLAFVVRRRSPAFFVGWFWFLGMLVPVLGLVQVGDQAWADRYAYLPTIGLYVLLVYGLADALPALASGLALAGFGAAAALAVVTANTLPPWQDSRSLFEHALEVTPQNWIAHNNAGLVYLERREIDRAREHFEAALHIRPSFVQAGYNLGLTQEAAGDFPAAIRTYQDLLVAHPGHAETLVRLASLARADANATQAQTFYEQAVDKNPRNALVWASFARFLLEQGDLDRATNCAASALKLDDSLADAHLVLAEIGMRRRDMDAAEKHLSRARELTPNSAEVHALGGRFQMQKNDFDAARKEFERAIQVEPNSARARFDYGTLLLNLAGQAEQAHDEAQVSTLRAAARAQFQAVNDIHPGDPEALTALGLMALEDGKTAEAIELLRDAAKRMPGSTPLTNLAFAHEKASDWKSAVECYERVMAQGNPDPAAACALAWILATGPDETLLDGARAVKLALYAAGRKAANAPEVLAASYARAGDYDKAIEVIKQALTLVRAPEQKRQLELERRLYEAHQPYTRTR